VLLRSLDSSVLAVFFHSRDHGYTIEQFPIFILIGIFGGFVGALFNWLNLKLTLFRLKYTKRPSVRVLEAVGIAIVTSLLSYLLSYFIHDCKRMDDNSLTTPGIELTRFQFYCPNGYYNDMATLFYTTPQLALRQLFHSTGDQSFSLTTLAVFCFVYFLLSCWTYGTSVPSGIFVPSLLIGAAYGRIVGEVVAYLAPSWGIFPGSFALIGAATMMGGVTRMTMSLTVMLIEATNDITYGLPIMVMLLIAKWVGDWFTSGIFDTYNETKFIPFLHWDAPYFMRKFFAQDIMTQPVYTFKKIEKVAHVYKVLKTTTHNGYPIVNHDGTFCGLILRSQLVTLLKGRDFSRIVTEGDQVRYQPLNPYPKSYMDFSADYPRYPKIQSVTVAEDDMDLYMTLKPYYNKYPFTILRNASLSRVYRLFRTMGLRHIVVVSRKNKVVGIITRKDLTHLEEKITSRRYANLDLDLEDTADSSDS
jgi:chloride channel 7